MRVPNAVIEVSVVVLALVAMFGTMYLAGGDTTGRKVVINCSISEISPDFTIEMREACRQARAKEISKELQKPK
jgi:predicted RND superfamily exporter protein